MNTSPSANSSFTEVSLFARVYRRKRDAQFGVAALPVDSGADEQPELSSFMRVGNQNVRSER